MARHLRIDIENGWYYVTARGTDCRSLFPDDSYSVHFLELLEEMSLRHGVEIHAYCLMGNHCHLILRTPLANASTALQWLNVSHSVWFNRKKNRVGPCGRLERKPAGCRIRLLGKPCNGLRKSSLKTESCRR